MSSTIVRSKRKSSELISSEDETQSDDTQLPLNTSCLMKQLIDKQKTALKQKRTEIKNLTSKIEVFEENKQFYIHQTNTIKTLWIQLNSDIQLLCERLQPELKEIPTYENSQFSNTFFEYLNETLIEEQQSELDIFYKTSSTNDDASNNEKKIPNIYLWTTNITKFLLSKIEFLYRQVNEKSDKNLTSSVNSYQILLDDLQSKCRSQFIELENMKCEEKSNLEEQNNLKDENGKLRIEIARLSLKINDLKSQIITKNDENANNLISSNFVKEEKSNNSLKEIEDLQNQLNAKEEEIRTVKELNERYLIQIESFNTSNEITTQQIVNSNEFKTLMQQTTEIIKHMENYINENEKLRNVILNEQNKKDIEYEKLMEEMELQKTNLFEIVSDLSKKLQQKQIDNQTSLSDTQIFDLINELKTSNENLKKNLEIQNLEIQNKNQKITNNIQIYSQLQSKYESLKQEKEQLLEELKQKENEMSKIFENINSNKQIFDEKSKLEAQNTINDLSRRLTDYKQLESDHKNLQNEIQQLSEEMDEVSKAFEELQIYCEEITKKYNDRTNTDVDKFLNQHNLINNNNKKITLLEQKIETSKQKYEKSEKLILYYLDALHQANKRAMMVDKQREQLSFLCLELQNSLQKKHKQTEEDLSKLNIAKETIKKNEEKLNKYILKINLIEGENIKLKEQNKNEIPPQDTSKILENYKDDILSEKDSLLVEENKEMRRRIVCSVCNERFKDHIIIKCGHSFCKECIHKNIKTRNRKCSLCKTNFDWKDTIKMYLV